MDWAPLLFAVPAALWVAAVVVGLALLRHRRETSISRYLFNGMRFFNPLWFKGEARALQKLFVRLFALFVVSVPAAAAAVILIG